MRPQNDRLFTTTTIKLPAIVAHHCSHGQDTHSWRIDGLVPDAVYFHGTIADLRAFGLQIQAAALATPECVEERRPIPLPAEEAL